MIKKLTQQAFTLLEIIVALLILAIIAAILVTGLHSVINTTDRITDVSQRLSTMQIATTVISNDMRQVINREVYNNNGEPVSAFILYSGPQQQLEFTRDGYINPMAQQQRSSLQRVTYRLHNGNVERGTWRVLDRAPNSNVSYNVIIPHVKNLQWKFLGPHNRVYSQWPNNNVAPMYPTPKAIELIITIKHWGTLHRWFVVEGYHEIIGAPSHA